MRGRTLAFLVCSLALFAPLSGCNSKRDRNSSSTTTAPVTSGGTGPITSGGGIGPINTGTANGNNSSSTLLASFQLKQVVEVEAASGTVKNTWAVGDGPLDVVNDGLFAYTANSMSQNVTVIDRLANNTVATVDVTQNITGIPLLGQTLDSLLKPLVRPTGVAVCRNGNRIYSANLLNVTVIDGQTMTPVKSILGLSPLNLAQIISNPTQALTNFMQSPIQGLGMAKVAATDAQAVVTCTITGKLMRINATTDTVIDYIPVGRAPIGVTIAQNKAYVACALSQEVWVVDLTTGQVVTTIQGQGMIPFDCGKSKPEDRVYVANAISGDVSVIDPALDLIVDTLPGGTSILSLFQQAGLTIPSASQGGISGLLNNFLQGYMSGMSNPGSFGNLLAGAGSGGSLLSPGALINGLITAFLGYAGFNQTAFGGLSLPGTLSVAVPHNADLVCTSNAFTGDLSVVDAPTKVMVSYPQLAGAGPVDLAPVWPR